MVKDYCMTSNNKNKTRKDLRFEREAKALQKNLIKRKSQKELLDKAVKEAKNG